MSRALFVAGSRLTGTIPAGIGALSNLTLVFCQTSHGAHTLCKSFRGLRALRLPSMGAVTSGFSKFTATTLQEACRTPLPSCSSCRKPTHTPRELPCWRMLGGRGSCPGNFRECAPLLPVHGELQLVLYHTPPPWPTCLHALRVLRRVLTVNNNYLTGTLPPGLSGLSKLR